jgi:hypothetical protein
MGQASSSDKITRKQACFMVGLFFATDDGGSTLLKNAGELLPV